MNSDIPNTFIRAAITVLSGAAILYAIGLYLGWGLAVSIVVVGIVDTAWCALQLWPWWAGKRGNT